MYRKISEIWMEEFNAISSSYQINKFILEDAHSCIYELKDGRELRISVSTLMYHFAKLLLSKSYKHVVRIDDCFKLTLRNQYDETANVFCIVSEGLNRDFAPRDVKQSGINLFRNIWSEYLKCSQSVVLCPDVKIEQAYADNDTEGKRNVIQRIKESTSNQIVKDIALSLHDTYWKIKKLDSNSSLYMFADNIGMSEDGEIKICNIAHAFVGLDENYEIDTTAMSVTVIYDPVVDEDFVIDRRMLISLKVDFGDGNLLPVLGQIDTGATSSGFTESFFKRASLIDHGKIRMKGTTGEMEAIRTKCEVVFPNGRKEMLHGSTMKSLDDVSILVGMDMLSNCKIHFEPYNYGFKYKIIFI